MVHHPYQSFDTVVRFVRDAAEDPDVLAIKMTLYRVSGNSPITRALTRAAERGKEVSVLVELKARFDEAANIQWARQLEQAGAHVIYGIVGFKTHCKVCLVVRREADMIRRYCHLGTGNYNDRTAQIYSDIGLFTCREEFGEDITQLFNLLTGYTLPNGFHHLILSPTSMREAMVARLHRESEHARRGRPSRVIAKMNALVDPDLIVELYRASQAGVEIQLVIRGICCLRPGQPGLSEHIRVIRIIDRFLEHVRLFYFHNDGNPEYLLSSADWMQRNLNGRIEIAFPVLDPALQQALWDFLELQLRDSAKGRLLQPDGTSVPMPVEGDPIHAQARFYEAACEMARTQIAVEKPLHPLYTYIRKEGG
jgi:polyphosphate kinase